MKISIRSDQESLVIYVGRAEASRHIITVTVILVGMGLLFFTGGVFFLVELLLEDQGIMKKDVKFNNIIFSFWFFEGSCGAEAGYVSFKCIQFSLMGFDS